jgi:hypothetical protein
MRFLFDAVDSNKDRQEISYSDFSLKLLQKFRWITQIEAEKVAQWLVGEGQAATYRKICKTISDNLMTQGAYDVITEREQTLLL